MSNYPALTTMEIQEFFNPIIELAEHLIKIHKTKQEPGIKELPVVTVSDLINMTDVCTYGTDLMQCCNCVQMQVQPLARASNCARECK